MLSTYHYLDLTPLGRRRYVNEFPYHETYDGGGHETATTLNTGPSPWLEPARRVSTRPGALQSVVSLADSLASAWP
ncbi:hypothetical protein Misp03_82590 [Microbispora sp. NBRC 16548]|nr:hypothetical protein Misp03_82590 [Microbispora sp. NBRC 16548]